MSITTRTNIKPKVLCLFGPTGSGKSALLNALLPGRGELISSDSIQVYHHLNIGSAKPSTDQMSLFPHHLIDILDPKVPFSMGDFFKKAQQLVPQIFKRKKIPVISGGTGFYFKHLIYSGELPPPADPTVRQNLLKKEKELGLGSLWEEAQKIDPLYCHKISPQDGLRIRRVIEVFQQTSRPLSSFLQTPKVREDWDVGLFALHWPREKLYHRINERVRVMFELGLEEEVKGLISMGYNWSSPGLKGIGYKEWQGYFEGGMDSHQVMEKIQQNSRRYAKRQMTFFRPLPEVQWLDGEHFEDNIQVLKDFLNP